MQVGIFDVVSGHPDQTAGQRARGPAGYRADEAALVGAGVVSVLLFPAIAAAINRRGKANPSIGEPIPVAGATQESDAEVTDSAQVPAGAAEQLRRWRQR
jgi:hypothetical protein